MGSSTTYFQSSLLCLGIINFITSKGCRNWFPLNSPATSLELQRQILDNEIWEKLDIACFLGLLSAESYYVTQLMQTQFKDPVFKQTKAKSGSSAAHLSPYCLSSFAFPSFLAQSLRAVLKRAWGTFGNYTNSIKLIFPAKVNG